MLWLVLLLVVAPLTELYVILQVAHGIGGWNTLALLLIESAIGAWLLKRQGLATLAKIRDAFAQGRVPDKELADGLLILVAGTLMLAPGFIGDVIGYLLLIPPTRAPVRALMLRRWRRRGGAGRFFTMATPGGRFVGNFRAGPGGQAFDTTGHDRTDPPSSRPELDA
jgi:UPF0716 protein FxsA